MEICFDTVCAAKIQPVKSLSMDNVGFCLSVYTLGAAREPPQSYQLKPNHYEKKALTLFFQYLFVVARPVFHRDAQHVYPGGHRSHVDAFQTV